MTTWLPVCVGEGGAVSQAASAFPFTPLMNPLSPGSSSPWTGTLGGLGDETGGCWERGPGVGVPEMSLNIVVQGHSLPRTSERAKMPLHGGPSTAPSP